MTTATAPKKSRKKTKAKPKPASPLEVSSAILDKKVFKSTDWRVETDPDQLKEPHPHLPTGSLIIDYLIGGTPNSFGVAPCPGLPRGKISNVYGAESSGKTTLALTAAATTCENGGTVGYLDLEHDIALDYAAAIGVPITDKRKFVLAQPNTLEDGFKILFTWASAGVDLIIVDSAGAGVPKAMFEQSLQEIGDSGRVGLVAALWSMFLPKLKGVMSKSGTHLMGISQTRAAINTRGPGGPSMTVQGGNAWKFFSSVRLKLRRLKQESVNRHNVLKHKTESTSIGGVIRAKLEKCKVSSNMGREEDYYIRWGSGIDDVRTAIEIAISYGLIKQAGSWVTWERSDGTTIKGQGKDKFRTLIKETPGAFEGLYTVILPKLTRLTLEADEEAEQEEEDDILLGELDALLSGPSDEVEVPDGDVADDEAQE